MDSIHSKIYGILARRYLFRLVKHAQLNATLELTIAERASGSVGLRRLRRIIPFL